MELVKACEACQFHAKQIHQPAGGLQTIPLSWPFTVWGLDILGPFPRVPGGYLYLYVVGDDAVRHPKSAHEALDELDCGACWDGADSFHQVG